MSHTFELPMVHINTDNWRFISFHQGSYSAFISEIFHPDQSSTFAVTVRHELWGDMEQIDVHILEECIELLLTKFGAWEQRSLLKTQGSGCSSCEAKH